jgi:hypothetical protein
MSLLEHELSAYGGLIINMNEAQPPKQRRYIC